MRKSPSATPRIRQPIPPPIRPPDRVRHRSRPADRTFVEVMDVLVAVVQRETELVRVGHLAKAAELEATKSDARDPISRSNCWVS
jgi:hypothetical protein